MKHEIDPPIVQKHVNYGIDALILLLSRFGKKSDFDRF